MMVFTRALDVLDLFATSFRGSFSPVCAFFVLFSMSPVSQADIKFEGDSGTVRVTRVAEDSGLLRFEQCFETCVLIGKRDYLEHEISHLQKELTGRALKSFGKDAGIIVGTTVLGLVAGAALPAAAVAGGMVATRAAHAAKGLVPISKAKKLSILKERARRLDSNARYNAKNKRREEALDRSKNIGESLKLEDQPTHPLPYSRKAALETQQHLNTLQSGGSVPQSVFVNKYRPRRLVGGEADAALGLFVIGTGASAIVGTALGAITGVWNSILNEHRGIDALRNKKVLNQLLNKSGDLVSSFETSVAFADRLDSLLVELD